MDAPAPTVRSRARSLSDSGWFQRAIIALIIVNAITLGLETSDAVMHSVGDIIRVADHIILAIFVMEILIRILAHGWRFFRDPWGVFDFVVVMVALIPSTGAFSVLRALRVLRVLRLASVLPRMRRVVEALLSSLPGLGAVVSILALLFYVAGVMATQLFGDVFPQWFGTLPRSVYSLFQIMTLESWSMGIVRPVMVEFPYAWAFFVPFILLATFTMLNLFIAVVVNAMQSSYHEQDAAVAEEAHQERAAMRSDLQALRLSVDEILDRLTEGRPSGTPPVPRTHITPEADD